MKSFYEASELDDFGFKSLGKNVSISRKSSIYNPSQISIGDNVRIDDFCFISAGEGGIVIGSFVHISAYSSLVGKGEIIVEDFVGVSSKVTIYSSNDDYTGEFLTNPMVPSIYTNVKSAPVKLCKHTLIGSGSIVLPGVTLHEGVAVGALSLVMNDCESFYIYQGNPAKKLIRRSKNLLKLEKEFIDSLN